MSSSKARPKGRSPEQCLTTVFRAGLNDKWKSLDLHLHLHSCLTYGLMLSELQKRFVIFVKKKIIIILMLVETRLVQHRKKIHESYAHTTDFIYAACSGLHSCRITLPGLFPFCFIICLVRNQCTLWLRMILRFWCIMVFGSNYIFLLIHAQ